MDRTPNRYIWENRGAFDVKLRFAMRELRILLIHRKPSLNHVQPVAAPHSVALGNVSLGEAFSRGALFLFQIKPPSEIRHKIIGCELAIFGVFVKRPRFMTPRSFRGAD